MVINQDDIRNAFYIIDGDYHTKILEIADFDNDEKIVYETVMEMLEENEIRFVYDDATIDNSTAFVLYRKNNRLLMEYIFCENDVFCFLSEGCVWVYPNFIPALPFEIAEIIIKIKAYAQCHSINIKIESSNKKLPEEILKRTGKDATVLSDKQVRKVLILAYFWRYGFFCVIAIMLPGGAFLFGGEAGGLFGLSIGMGIYGCYLLLGAVLGFRHIYCIYQNANHQKMTPNQIYWNTLKKSDIYGVPIFCIAIGLIGAIISILSFYGIV
jgi:hypothetical protein